MLQFILAVALRAQVPNPPTDQQVLAGLPETDAVRTEVAISKIPLKTWGGTVWACTTYYTEVRDGIPMRRAQVVYLRPGRKDDWNAPAVPALNPNRR